MSGVVRAVNTIPRFVLDRAEKEQLGEPVRVYSTSAARRRGLVWLVILGLVGAGVAAAAIHFLLTGIAWAGALAALIAAAYLVPAGRILVRVVLPGARRALYLFDQGFVHVRRRGARERVVNTYAWDLVHGVRMSGTRRSSGDRAQWRFEVKRIDGEQLILGPEINDPDGFGEIISAQVTERMLPKYLARLDTGGKVEFGPFEVTRDGIAKDGEMVPWSRVHEVGSSNGMVYVSQQAGLMTLATTSGQVPNIVALLAISEHLTGVGD